MPAPSISIDLTITAAGAQSTPPAVLWANLINLVAAETPGYTILPAGLIEDIASTDTFALALQDSAAVELINSITPYSANPWLLAQLGQVYGVAPVVQSNGSVYVVFTGTPGFQIPPGFIVSDGTYQYQIQDGGVIESGGASSPLFCLSLTAGIFPIAADTVIQIISAVPSSITLSVNNPQDGIPSAQPQTEADYRALVLSAGLVSGQGNASMAKTLLAAVSGVQGRLVSVVQINGGGWEVIVGGGDPYAVAQAVYDSGLDISTLVGSTIGIVSVTKANPAVVTCNLNPGFTNGQAGVVIAGATGMTGINGTWTVTTTALNPNQFSIAYNSTSAPTYTGGGVVTPNSRNVSVNLNGYPNTYTVPLVIPPSQAVTVQLTWNTISPNFVSDVAMQQQGAAAISAYINSIPVGAPMNLFEMDAVFQAATANLVATALLTRLQWSVSIDGVETDPEAGTGIIVGDPESYFICSPPDIIITQG